MTKKKLFDDIKQDPARIYRTPADVLRDRRFADDERLEILTAWRARGEPGDSGEIDALIADLQSRLCNPNHHAAE
jgi:hypothetical protein